MNSRTVLNIVREINRRERRAIILRSAIAAVLAFVFMLVVAKLAWSDEHWPPGGQYRMSDPIMIPQAGDQNPDPRLVTWSWWFEIWCITRWLWWLVFGRSG